jgi:hypothetical protein
LVGETASDVYFRLELSKIFSSEAHTVLASTVYFGLTFVWTVAELLGGVTHLAVAVVLEGTGLILG